MSNNEPKPVLLAARAGDVGLLKELIASGEDPCYVHDPPGVWGAKTRESLLHALLRAMPGDDKRNNPADGGDNKTVGEVWVEGVRLLLDKGADVNGNHEDYDWRGCGSTQTAFQMYLGHGLRVFPELLADFLRHGANPNEQQTSSRHSMRTDASSTSTPIHTVVRLRSLEGARALIAAGCDVNFAAQEHMNNEYGYAQDSSVTPLHQACQHGDVAMAELLLDNGARVNDVHRFLQHVDVPREGGNDEWQDPRQPGFVPTVRNVPVRQTALHIALKRCVNKKEDTDAVRLVRLLLARGADPSVPYEFDKKRVLAPELCEGDADLRKVVESGSGWSPESHSLFPARVRAAVFALLCVMKRRPELRLPEGVAHLVFGGLAKAV